MVDAGNGGKSGSTWADVFRDFSKFLIPAGLVLIVALVLLLVLGKAIELGTFGKIQIVDQTKRLTAVQVEPPSPNKDMRFPKSGWGVTNDRGSAGGNGAIIPESEKFAFCSISGVWVTPKIDNPSNCELYQNSSHQWIIRVTPEARCQVTCFQ